MRQETVGLRPAPRCYRNRDAVPLEAVVDSRGGAVWCELRLSQKVDRIAESMLYGVLLIIVSAAIAGAAMLEFGASHQQPIEQDARSSEAG